MLGITPASLSSALCSQDEDAPSQSLLLPLGPAAAALRQERGQSGSRKQGTASSKLCTSVPSPLPRQPLLPTCPQPAFCPGDLTHPRPAMAWARRHTPRGTWGGLHGALPPKDTSTWNL